MVKLTIDLSSLNTDKRKANKDMVFLMSLRLYKSPGKYKSAPPKSATPSDYYSLAIPCVFPPCTYAIKGV